MNVDVHLKRARSLSIKDVDEAERDHIAPILVEERAEEGGFIVLSPVSINESFYM